MQIRGDEYSIDAASSQLIYHKECVYRVTAKQRIYLRWNFRKVLIVYAIISIACLRARKRNSLVIFVIYTVILTHLTQFWYLINSEIIFSIIISCFRIITYCYNNYNGSYYNISYKSNYLNMNKYSVIRIIK